MSEKVYLEIENPENWTTERVNQAINKALEKAHIQVNAVDSIKNVDEIAEMTGEVTEDIASEIEEYIWFDMKDNVHDFKIGLSDVLSALKFAEEQGFVPKIDEKWWCKLRLLYPKIVNEEYEDVVCESLKRNRDEM